MSRAGFGVNDAPISPAPALRVENDDALDGESLGVDETTPASFGVSSARFPGDAGEAFGDRRVGLASAGVATNEIATTASTAVSAHASATRERCMVRLFTLST
jgi:hypothetical protein